MSEAVMEMTREELIAERDKYRAEADRQYQNKCKSECQIREMQFHIDCLKAELAEVKMNKQELPLEPIEVAAMLVKATITRKVTPLQKAFNANLSNEYEADRYSDDDLRQIAEHLLVYCNHAEVE